MDTCAYIDALVCYAINHGLAHPDDWTYLVNRLLEAMALDDYTPSQGPLPEDLPTILEGMLSDAVARGLCQDNITQHGKTCCYAAGSWIGKYRNI